jgi:hypothetical protein
LFEKIKVFLKNQKHEPNIVEITHLCIMHGAHTSIYMKENTRKEKTKNEKKKNKWRKLEKKKVTKKMVSGKGEGGGMRKGGR